MTGMHKEADLKHRTKHPIFLTNYPLRASLQAIDIGDVLVFITIVSAKQVYNSKVKLFNKIEPFHL